MRPIRPPSIRLHFWRLHPARPHPPRPSTTPSFGMSMSTLMSIVYSAESYNISTALSVLSYGWRSPSQVVAWSCCCWESGLGDCPAQSPRPSGLQQRRLDDQRYWAGDVVLSTNRWCRLAERGGVCYQYHSATMNSLPCHFVASWRRLNYTLEHILISTLVTVFTVRVGEHNFNVIIIIIIIIITALYLRQVSFRQFLNLPRE